MALALADIIGNALSDVTSSGATRTVNLPTTDVVAGMMMYVVISINKDAVDIGEVLTNGDYDKVDSFQTLDASSTPRCEVWKRLVTAADATTDFTSSDTAIGHIAVAFAVDGAAEAIDVVGTAATGTGVEVTNPAVTASATGGLTIRISLRDDDDQASQIVPSGHTAINWEKQASPTNGSSIFVSVELQPSTSVGSEVTDDSNDEEWGGQTFVIAEAVAGGSIVPILSQGYSRYVGKLT